jgi:hypothetical protein
VVVPRTRVCGFSREESVSCAGPDARSLAEQGRTHGVYERMFELADGSADMCSFESGLPKGRPVFLRRNSKAEGEEKEKPSAPGDTFGR